MGGKIQFPQLGIIGFLLTPKLIGKHERRFTAFDDKIIALYARGMTVREIQGFLAEMYGTEVAPELISTVTDAVLAEITVWQSRPLEPMYPVLFFDALRVKIREDNVVATRRSTWPWACSPTAPATFSGCGSRTPRTPSSG
jgi:transposase-like protein